MPSVALAKSVVRRRGRGAPPGEAHGRAVLTDEKVRVIRALDRHGIPKSRIAEIFRIAPATVGQIVHRHTWKHVAEEK